MENKQNLQFQRNFHRTAAAALAAATRMLPFYTDWFLLFFIVSYLNTYYKQILLVHVKYTTAGVE